MVLLDKKIFAGGIVMIAFGMAIAITMNESPLGESGMTEEEIIDLMIAEDENQAYQMLSGILVGVGFLLVLISFGARRKKGSAKKTEKKPAE
ncbi:hypothetical protein [Nitrosopumilus sp.]|uniref:hypothetical protein n=1 Tax=Nitrosopumilus sp. TaxID=2024843 RepID=UPI00260E6606|nr:hypothetical protein [Nitrosopumilus sp.]